MSEGWIKLHRSIMECEDLASKDAFSRREAWIDMLLMANFTDKTWWNTNIQVEVPRGSFISSFQALQKKWKWGRRKIEGFFSVIVRCQMCTCKSTHQYTHFFIINYNTYQEKVQTNVHTKVQADVHTDVHADVQLLKNDKNDKNVKNTDTTPDGEGEGQIVPIKKIKSWPPEGNEIRKLVYLTEVQISAILKKITQPELDYWLDQLTEVAQQSPEKWKKKYKDHLLVIRAWRRRRLEDGKAWDAIKKIYAFPPKNFSGALITERPQPGNFKQKGW